VSVGAKLTRVSLLIFVFPTRLSPDKNRNVLDIQARFARLGVITNILRNSEERARYDVSNRHQASTKISWLTRIYRDSHSTSTRTVSLDGEEPATTTLASDLPCCMSSSS
jgi:hypothetical protein